MRLLNIHSLEMKEFFDNDIPRYYILSHRWGDSEMTYKDFVKGRCRDTPGFWKISNFCSFAKDLNRLRELGALGEDFARKIPVSWAWIDTCE